MGTSKYTLESVKLLGISMSCDQCDEMFNECIGEVDPDNPGGYEVCQLLWDHCKSQCSGVSSLTREETRVIVKRAYAALLTPPEKAS